MPKSPNGSDKSSIDPSITGEILDPVSTERTELDLPGEDTEISKSQRKREASAITELAREISELPQSDFDALPMEPSVRDAIAQLRKIKQFGARKRQLLYAGKVLRKSDPVPLEAALAERKNLNDGKNLHFHTLENWRDELIGEQGDQALTRLLNQYPHIDRQRLRQLVRKSRVELERQQAPKSSRELFRLLREMLDTPSE